MKKNLIYLIVVMSLGAVFVGCDDADERANEIIAERERAQAFAKMELELAQLKRDAEAKDRAAADRQVTEKQAEVAAERDNAEALAAAAKEAQAAALRAKAEADASRNIGQAQDAATKAQQAAENALLAAKKAEELNNNLRLELARLKAEADSKTKYYPVPPNPHNPPYNPVVPGATVVGAFGGTVKSPGGSGAAIYVPPGSLKAGIPITINVVPPPPQIAGLAPLCAVSFTPHGTTFNPPAVVVFPLPAARPPGSPILLTYWDAANLRYQYPNPKIWAKVSFKNPKYAVARISHFSTVVLCDTAEVPAAGWDQGMPQGAEDNVPAPDNFQDDRPYPQGPRPNDFEKPYPNDDNNPHPPRDGGFTPPHEGGRPVLPDGTYPGGPNPIKDGGAYHPEGQPHHPEGQPGKPEGQPYHPEGQPHHPEGQPGKPEGQPYRPEGQPHHPDGQPGIPDEPPYLPEGQPNHPEGKTGKPEGQPYRP